MTRRLFGSLGATALLACFTVALPANAQGQTNKVRVTVPFDFQVNGISMSAGQYYFESPVQGGMIYVTTPTGDRHAAIAMPLGDPMNPRKPQVVFERLGERYRLSEVWLGGAAVGSGVQRTKSEKEYARQFGKGSVIALSMLNK